MQREGGRRTEKGSRGYLRDKSGLYDTVLASPSGKKTLAWFYIAANKSFFNKNQI